MEYVVSMVESICALFVALAVIEMFSDGEISNAVAKIIRAWRGK
jgi:hypothetical protein